MKGGQPPAYMFRAYIAGTVVKQSFNFFLNERTNKKAN